MIRKGVVFFDIHYPFQNKAALAIALRFLEDFKPDIFVFGGDAMDMGSISAYVKKKPKLLEGKRLAKEYKDFQRDVINKLKLSPNCERHYIIGNHEQRVRWLIEAEPQFEGFVELENNLDLKGWHITPYGGVLQFGDMYIIHGDIYSEQHAKKNVQNYGCNIFSGHVHTNQVYTMNTPISNAPRQGVSVGCLSDTNPDYKNSSPNAWINQFLIFYTFPDGTFSYLTPIILNNRAIILNHLYQYNSKTTKVIVRRIK